MIKMRVFRILPTLVVLATVMGPALGQVKATPKQQAAKLMNAIHKEDWKALYYLIAVPASERKNMKGPDGFAADVKRGMESSDNPQAAHQVFAGMTNIMTGNATIVGNKATVPTSCSITIN